VVLAAFAGIVFAAFSHTDLRPVSLRGRHCLVAQHQTGFRRKMGRRADNYGKALGLLKTDSEKTIIKKKIADL